MKNVLALVFAVVGVVVLIDWITPVLPFVLTPSNLVLVAWGHAGLSFFLFFCAVGVSMVRPQL